jgi:hypothetical protein
MMLSLVTFGLLPSVLCAQGSSSQSRQHSKPGKYNKIFRGFVSSSSESIPERTFVVTSGWLPKADPLGSQDAAQDDALEKARDQVIRFLRDQKLGGEWKPNVTFVRDRLLADLRKDEVVGKDTKGELQEFLIGDRFRAVEETRTVDDQGQEKETRRVWVKVAINPENWKQIQNENRLAEDQKRVKLMRSRMVLLVKFLAGIVALLATVCGYLRLDEWSKGYYTKWLKLAAVGCVGVVTVLLWHLVAR